MTYPPTLLLHEVSIHAPARGATKSYIRPIIKEVTFQFTLPRGERLKSSPEPMCLLSFQFTLPRGERLSFFFRAESSLRFQFTLPRGERQGCRCSRCRGARRFNSRSREGSDRSGVSDIQSGLCFNSRSREGSDVPSVKSEQVLVVSFHAPARGATGLDSPKIVHQWFQFTLPRGERPSRVE